MSEFPHGWSTKTIDEACEIHDFRRVPLSGEQRRHRKGPYPYFGANNIQDYIDDFIFDFDAVLLAEDGGYYDEHEHRDIAQYATGRYWVNNHAHILTGKPGLDTKFLYYALARKNICPWINTGTRSKLNQSDMKQIELLVPPLPEQKKIAEILSGVDDSIRREEERLDALSCLLQSQLRSQRFSTGEMVTMAEACLLVADCMHKTPEFEETGFPIVRTPNVREGKLILEGMKFISEASYQEWIQKDKPEPGDILFTREAPLGEACLVPKNFPLCIGQRMMLLRANPRILSPEFLLFRLRSLTTQRKSQLLSGGSTVGHANVKDIRSLEIEIPNASEQRDAVSLYESISKSINGHAIKRQKLLHLKSGLASDLLSGRKRVTI
jgi:type I restriction enzyme S subunit